METTNFTNKDPLLKSRIRYELTITKDDSDSKVILVAYENVDREVDNRGAISTIKAEDPSCNNTKYYLHYAGEICNREYDDSYLDKENNILYLIIKLSVTMTMVDIKDIIEKLTKIKDNKFLNKYNFLLEHAKFPLIWNNDEIIALINAKEDIENYLNKFKQTISGKCEDLKIRLCNGIDKDIYAMIEEEVLSIRGYESIYDVCSLDELSKIYDHINTVFSNSYKPYLADLKYYPFMESIVKISTDLKDSHRIQRYIEVDMKDEDKNKLRENALQMYDKIIK